MGRRRAGVEVRDLKKVWIDMGISLGKGDRYEVVVMVSGEW
jgi:hypothetical protein